MARGSGEAIDRSELIIFFHKGELVDALPVDILGDEEAEFPEQ